MNQTKFNARVSRKSNFRAVAAEWAGSLFFWAMFALLFVGGAQLLAAVSP